MGLCRASGLLVGLVCGLVTILLGVYRWFFLLVFDGLVGCYMVKDFVSVFNVWYWWSCIIGWG